jgi:hypothetical protein
MKDFLEQLHYSLDITPVESYHYLFDQFRARSYSRLMMVMVLWFPL